MTELGDYRRLVEKPMIEAHIAELRRKDAEIERLRAENEKLRRWRALDKPLTAAMEIANSHLAPMCAENERLRADLATACRQWKMYADMEPDRDLQNEMSPEGEMYRRLARAPEQKVSKP